MNGIARSITTNAHGVEVIVSTCSKGHRTVEPNKGLGRARVATWESRHQHEDEATR